EVSPPPSAEYLWIGRPRRYVRSRLPGVVGEQRDLDAVVELELLEHTRDVCLDGRDAHVELAADLGVRLALPDRDGDLALAFGQAVELLASVALAVAGLAVPHVADQPAGDRGREHRLASGDGPHGADDVGGRRVLEQESAGATSLPSAASPTSAISSAPASSIDSPARTSASSSTTSTRICSLTAATATRREAGSRRPARVRARGGRRRAWRARLGRRGRSRRRGSPARRRPGLAPGCAPRSPALPRVRLRGAAGPRPTAHACARLSAPPGRSAARGDRPSPGPPPSPQRA